MNKPTALPAEARGAIVPNTLIDLLRAAVDKGADVATLERLAKLYEAAELGQKKAEFNNALAAAKAELRPIVKDQAVQKSTGGKLYGYESMAAIAAEIDPVLGKHGLYAIFPDAEHTEKHEPNRIYVTCRLCHRNGYSIEKTLDGPPDVGQNRNAVQAMGSTMTYLQRYALRAILGLAVTNEKEPKQRFADRPEIGAPAGDNVKYNNLSIPAANEKAQRPQLIPRGDGEQWEDWTAVLLRMVNNAKTLPLADEWWFKNDTHLQQLLKEKPAHHAFVKREFTKCARKLRGSNAT
jgi:ERF superfamily